MGRKMSSVKSALMATCEKKGLIARKTDSVTTLIHRLSQHEKAPAKLDPSVKKKKNKKPNAIKTLYSTPDKPLPAAYKAQAFVDDNFDGDLSQAGPEWKKGAKEKVKLMIPELRGTKVGNRVRWVLFK